MSKIDSTNFQSEIDSYKIKLKNQNSDSNLSATPSADKERTFNLIIVKKGENCEVIPTLSIEFSFFIKEKGNKLNHFDEEILDLLFFDDMNIEICEEEYEKIEEKKVEFETESHIEKKKYQP